MSRGSATMKEAKKIAGQWSLIESIADALAARDARIAELTEQRDTALAAMQILADRLKEVQPVDVDAVIAAAIADIESLLEPDERGEKSAIYFNRGVKHSLAILRVLKGDA